MASAEFQALIDEITGTEGVEDSATALINTFAQKVADLTAQLADSPTKDQLTQLAADMRAHADPLAAAVAANSTPPTP